MDWTWWAVAAAVIFVFFILKSMRLVSRSKARQLLSQGALIIDVRTQAEFRQEHLRSAINIPLNTLLSEIPAHAPDKSRPLLLHCLGGGRSEVARIQLKNAGYTNVHNLGSLTRARSIAAQPTRA